MFSAIFGAVLMTASMLLWAFAARLSLDPAAAAWTKGYPVVIGLPFLVTLLLVLGVAFTWSFAAGYPHPWNWAVGLGLATLVPVTYRLAWRGLGVDALYRDALARQTAARLRAAAPASGGPDRPKSGSTTAAGAHP